MMWTDLKVGLQLLWEKFVTAEGQRGDAAWYIKMAADHPRLAWPKEER